MADGENTIRRKAWATWLDHQLAMRSWRPTDLINASGKTLTSSQISRWLAASTGPDIDGLRSVAAALDVPVLEALIAAQYLTATEAAVTVIETERSLDDFTVGDLLTELARRYDVEHTVDSALPDVPEGAYHWPKSAGPSARRPNDHEPKDTHRRMGQ